MARSRREVLWWVAAAAALVLGWLAWWAVRTADRPMDRGASMLALWLAAGIIAACAWRSTAAPDAFDAPFLPTLALAASLPLSMVPVAGVSDALAAWAMVGSGLAMVPLGWTMAGRLPRRLRRWTRMALLLAATLAVALGIGVAAGDGLVVRAWWWVAVAASVGISTVALAVEVARADGRAMSRAPAPRVHALTVAVIGSIPIVAGLVLTTPAWPVVLVPAIAAVITGVAHVAVPGAAAARAGVIDHRPA